MLKPHMIDSLKNWVLVLGALGGLAAGGYAVIAKPIQEEGRVRQLETQMAIIAPKINHNEVSIAVIQSQLNTLNQNQDKILTAVLEIKKRL